MKFFHFIKDRFPLLIALFFIGLVFFSILNYTSSSKEGLLRLDTDWQYWVGDLPEADRQVPIGALVEKASSWKTLEDIGTQSLEGIFDEGDSSSNTEVVWFKKQLPDSLWDNANPSIYFENIYAQSLEMYLGDKKIFERNRDWLCDINKVIISITNDHKDSLLYIKLESAKEFDRIALTSRIFAGNHNVLVSKYLKKDFFNIVIGFVISILGVIIIFCSLFITKDHRKGWIPLGLFFILIGVQWALSPNNLGSYFPNIEKYLIILIDICKFLLPVFLVFYFDQIFGTGHKLFIRRLWQVQTVFSILSLSVLFINILTTYQFITIYYIMRGILLPFFYAVEVLALVSTSLYFSKRGNTDAKIFSLGISSLLFSVILDIINISINAEHQLILYKFGTLIFIIFLASILGRRIASNYNQVIAYSKELEVKNTDLDAMWKEVTSSRDQLAHLNQTLELRILERTEELEMANEELTAMNEELHSSNDELMHTLEILRKTQDQLIESEKMAALGQLVAGVAHEINTPIGAIRASVENISESLGVFLDKLPLLPTLLLTKRKDDFFHLLKNALQRNAEKISSREERALRRNLLKQLEQIHVKDADKKSDMLATMGIFDATPYVPLLKDPESSLLVKTIYILSGLQRSAKTIKEATNRTSKVIFALRSYSHFDHSSQMIQANVRDGIETVLTLYHNKIKHGVQVVRNYQDVEPIWCYPDELSQVWTNLISNALQAMDYHGTLQIDLDSTTAYLIVSISDTGTGIPEEIRHKIFDPFFTTKAQGEGSGLGLDIVRRIIDKHKGRIEVESIPGKTTFSVYLPRTQD